MTRPCSTSCRRAQVQLVLHGRARRWGCPAVDGGGDSESPCRMLPGPRRGGLDGHRPQGARIAVPVCAGLVGSEPESPRRTRLLGEPADLGRASPNTPAARFRPVISGCQPGPEFCRSDSESDLPELPVTSALLGTKPNTPSPPPWRLPSAPFAAAAPATNGRCWTFAGTRHSRPERALCTRSTLRTIPPVPLSLRSRCGVCCTCLALRWFSYLAPTTSKIVTTSTFTRLARSELTALRVARVIRRGAVASLIRVSRDPCLAARLVWAVCQWHTGNGRRSAVVR